MVEAKKAKKETLSSSEQMAAVLNRKRPDRIPFIPFIAGFCAKNVAYPIASIYEDAEKSFWAQMWTQRKCLDTTGRPDMVLPRAGVRNSGVRLEWREGNGSKHLLTPVSRPQLQRKWRL